MSFETMKKTWWYRLLQIIYSFLFVYCFLHFILFIDEYHYQSRKQMEMEVYYPWLKSENIIFEEDETEKMKIFLFHSSAIENQEIVKPYITSSFIGLLSLYIIRFCFIYLLTGERVWWRAKQ